MLATPFIAMLLFASPGRRRGPSTRPSTEDQIFVTKAAKDGQAEVELATLAQKKASERTGRGRWPAQLRADHERANAELMEIARRKGINVDPRPRRSSGRWRRS